MVNSLGELLEQAAEKNVAQVHFWHNAKKIETISYPEILERSLLITGALQKQGVEPGDRVALVLPTHPEFYYAFFGIILAGAIPAALYPPVRLGKVGEWKLRTSRMLKALSARLVLTNTSLLGMMGEPVREASPRFGCKTVKKLLQQNDKGKYIPKKKEDTVVVQFSSGTTGHPKPIALSHENILSNASAILASFPGEVSGHSGVSWLPLYHDMGLVGCMISAIMVMGDLTLIRPEQFVARPRIWLEALSHTKATISVAPNFAFGLCNNRISEKELSGLDLSSWKIALCGAEAVHPDTLETFAQKFSSVGFEKKALTPVYGLAEATLAVSFSPTEEPPLYTLFHREKMEQEGKAVIDEKNGVSLASVGAPLVGVEIEIRDEEGKILPLGTVGRVCCRGKSVFKEYLDLPEETLQAKPEGWLDTGDRGFIFEGNLYLCGRYKDVIILRGRNYDPAQVEQALEGIQGLRSGCVAAFGVTDSKTGTEKLVLLSEYKEPLHKKEDMEAEIKAQVLVHCNLQVAELELLVPGTLPRTSSGKIRRGEARRLWLAGDLEAPVKAGVATFARHTLTGMWSHYQAKQEQENLPVNDDK